MGDSGATDIGQNVSWTITLEDYFAQTGEKANGLSIMHKRAESIFARRKTYIDLPVIVGSGAVAFLNAGSSSLFAGNAQLAATPQSSIASSTWRCVCPVSNACSRVIS